MLISQSSWPMPCHLIVVFGQLNIRSIAPSVSKSPAGPVGNYTNLEETMEKETGKAEKKVENRKTINQVAKGGSKKKAPTANYTQPFFF